MSEDETRRGLGGVLLCFFVLRLLASVLLADAAPTMAGGTQGFGAASARLCDRETAPGGGPPRHGGHGAECPSCVVCGQDGSLCDTIGRAVSTLPLCDTDRVFIPLNIRSRQATRVLRSWSSRAPPTLFS